MGSRFFGEFQVEENGIEGLLEKSRRKPRIGNRVDESIEQKILDYALEFPTHGQVRVANELLKNHGITVSSGGVRSDKLLLVVTPERSRLHARWFLGA